MKFKGRSSVELNNIYLAASAVVCGPKEFNGPLGLYMDKGFDDIYCNEESWEKAEISLQLNSMEILIRKSGILKSEIDCIVGGDLNNQLAATNYAVRKYDIPYVGIFGACSTSVLGIIQGALYLSNMKGNVLALTSSHNATAERQFRYPNEYGGQKAKTATLTVTGASCTVLSNIFKSDIKVTKATIGKVIDPLIKDTQDMGRIMAPSAFSTIKDHLYNYDETIDDYDLIVTGDLSEFGSDMLIKMFKEEGIDITNKYIDSGNCIYDKQKQKVLGGGSGCACLGVFFNSYLIEKLKERKYKKILVVATGALLNPVIVSQKETVPGVSHAITVEVVK